MCGSGFSPSKIKEFVYKDFRFSLKKVIFYANFTIIHAWKRKISLIFVKKTKKEL